MTEQAIMPKLGLTMKSGTITAVHKKVGDCVERGELIAEFETDKISGEIVSPIDGYILEMKAKPGEDIGVLEATAVVGDAMNDQTAKSNSEVRSDIQEPVYVAPVKAASCDAHWTPASPLARSMAKNKDIDLSNVLYSGRMVYSKDVKAYSTRQTKATHAAQALAGQNGLDVAKISGSGEHGRVMKADVGKAIDTLVQPDMPGERTKMSSMRRTIAQRLSESKQTIPHVYFKKEVDATKLLQLQKSIDAEALGVKVTINDIILKIVAEALAKRPELCVRIDGEYIEQRPVNLGFAVSIDQGLIVPVIPDADQKSLKSIAKLTKELAQKAKSGKLTMDEFSGGSFTVSNLGAFGIDEFYAIVNPPESAILAVGAIKKKPVCTQEGIEQRDMVTLCLSADHRVIDGGLAASFMKQLADMLEDVVTYLI